MRGQNINQNNSQSHLTGSTIPSHNAHGVPLSVSQMECGQCATRRPITAAHCYECGLCVDQLDHHCPVCPSVRVLWIHVCVFVCVCVCACVCVCCVLCVCVCESK